jgi:hypothetical protein
MGLREVFLDEFASLSKKIQNNELQGRIQIFFRLADEDTISKERLTEALGVNPAILVSAMENFILYGVVEESDDTYTYKGYPPEFKDLVAMLPDRKKKLQEAVDNLVQATDEEETRGTSVETYRRVIEDIKRDFGLK